MTGQAYFIGRTPGKIEHPYSGVDAIYGGERLDGLKVENPKYEHCTFANVSFLNGIIDGGNFLNCAFISCYFRRTDLRNCRFSSCRFIDCEFPGASFGSCDFRYARFAGCFIPFHEIEHNLPSEPNLREDLCQNLAREAAVLGDPRTARTYRLCEVKARESNYWAAVMAKSKWYKDHYDVLARVGVAFKIAGSLLNRMFFGYGELLGVVIRNYVMATFVFFPLLFYLLPNALTLSSTGVDVSVWQPTVWDALQFSLNNAVAGALHSPIEAVGWSARIISVVQIVLTAIWASLVAVYLFRWSLRR